jgi:hypothetical protein
MINNRCGYFSKQWVGGPFVVMLRLTPLSNDKPMQNSFFERMDKSKRHDRQARWIKRGQLKFWNFHIFYHLSRYHNIIEYIVVKAVYPSKYVDPHILYQSVKESLGRIWHIDVENSTFTFKVGFNDHIKYRLIFKETMVHFGINKSNEFAFIPSFELFCKTVPKDKFNSGMEYNEVLFPAISYIDENVLNEGFFVTELFFCYQVNLYQEEFEFQSSCLNTIFFKVTNVTLHRFSLVKTNDEKLQNTGDEKKSNSLAKQTVRICASEFPNNLTIATFAKIPVLITMTVSILISVSYRLHT